MIRKRVVAHGRVQGVFFRDTTRRQADTLGVAGWVSNRDDGAVESMVEFLRRGPGRAEVEQLEVNDEAPECLEKFLIR